MESGHYVSVLDIQGMFCHNCEEKIEEDFKALNGVHSVKVTKIQLLR